MAQRKSTGTPKLAPGSPNFYEEAVAKVITGIFLS